MKIILIMFLMVSLCILSVCCITQSCKTLADAQTDYDFGYYEDAVYKALKAKKLKPTSKAADELAKKSYVKAKESYIEKIKKLEQKTNKFDPETTIPNIEKLISEYKNFIEFNENLNLKEKIPPLKVAKEKSCRKLIEAKKEKENYLVNLALEKEKYAMTEDDFNNVIEIWKKVLELNTHNEIAPEKIIEVNKKKVKYLVNKVLQEENNAKKKDDWKNIVEIWEKVLELDPDNNIALEHKNKALKRSLKKMVIRFENSSGKNQFGDIATMIRGKIIEQLSSIKFIEIIPIEIDINNENTLRNARNQGIDEILIGLITQISVQKQEISTRTEECEYGYTQPSVYTSQGQKAQQPQKLTAKLFIHEKSANASIDILCDIINVEAGSLVSKTFTGNYEYGCEWATSERPKEELIRCKSYYLLNQLECPNQSEAETIRNVVSDLASKIIHGMN